MVGWPEGALGYLAAPHSSSSRTISACWVLDAGEPEPLRPVVIVASWIGVVPLPLTRQASAPPSRSTWTAAEQRVRTARWSGATPLLSTAFGSAPAARRLAMVAASARHRHHGPDRRLDRGLALRPGRTIEFPRVREVGPVAKLAAADDGAMAHAVVGHREVGARRHRWPRCQLLLGGRLGGEGTGDGHQGQDSGSGVDGDVHGDCGWLRNASLVPATTIRDVSGGARGSWLGEAGWSGTLRVPSILSPPRPHAATSPPVRVQREPGASTVAECAGKP